MTPPIILPLGEYLEEHETMFEMNFMLKEPFTALKQVRYKIMQWN
jgi:hypothetical protein